MPHCTWPQRTDSRTACNLSTGVAGGLCPLHERQEAGVLLAAEWVRRNISWEVAERMVRAIMKAPEKGLYDRMSEHAQAELDADLMSDAGVETAVCVDHGRWIVTDQHVLCPRCR